MESARKIVNGFNGVVDFWRGKSAAERSTTLNLTISVELPMFHGVI